MTTSVPRFRSPLLANGRITTATGAIVDSLQAIIFADMQVSEQYRWCATLGDTRQMSGKYTAVRVDSGSDDDVIGPDPRAQGDRDARPLMNSEGYRAEEEDAVEPHAVEEPQSPHWNFFHFIFFFLGGSCFIVGTVTYYNPTSESAALWGAMLYTIGSAGFFAVDALELITFTRAPRHVRINISLSMVGSAFYIIGSMGFFPYVISRNTQVGPWGFIIGSLLIGSSQLWKTYRIGAGGDELAQRCTCDGLFNSRDSFTQMGVELSAGFGAWFFFFSTIVYLKCIKDNFADMDLYYAIVDCWLVGSCFFTMGAFFLGYRHFVMRV
jgi:hypothetical protein